MGEKDEGWRTSDSVDGAADHLSDAFNESSNNLKKHANEASKAMQKKKYRSALISLQEIKLSGEVESAKEGMAVRDSQEHAATVIEGGSRLWPHIMNLVSMEGSVRGCEREGDSGCQGS